MCMYVCMHVHAHAYLCMRMQIYINIHVCVDIAKVTCISRSSCMPAVYVCACVSVHNGFVCVTDR